MPHGPFWRLMQVWYLIETLTNKIGNRGRQAKLVGKPRNTEVIHLVVENDAGIGS